MTTWNEFNIPGAVDFRQLHECENHDSPHCAYSVFNGDRKWFSCIAILQWGFLRDIHINSLKGTTCDANDYHVGGALPGYRLTSLSIDILPYGPYCTPSCLSVAVFCNACALLLAGTQWRTPLLSSLSFHLISSLISSVDQVVAWALWGME